MRLLTKLNKIQWSEFIHEHPQGNIFQGPEMYELYKLAKKYEPLIFAVINNKEEILAIMLCVIHKIHNGLLGLFSSRSIIIGGPLVLNNNKEVLTFLLNAYNISIRRKVIYTQIRNLFDQSFYNDIFKIFGFKYESHLNILISLNQNRENLLINIQKNKRRNVTKAINHGVKFIEIQKENELDLPIDLIRNTYIRVKLPFPDNKFFKLAFNILYPKGILKIFGAYYREKIIGVRFQLIHKGIVYDWYSGSDDNYNNRYPNDFLIYNILIWGHEKQFQTFDFGGAGKSGVYYGVRNHKMKFGGDLVEFGRFEKIHKSILFKIAKGGFIIWQKLRK